MANGGDSATWCRCRTPCRSSGCCFCCCCCATCRWAMAASLVILKFKHPWNKIYVYIPARAATPPPDPPLEKPNGVGVEVLNPIEKCYFNADARLLRAGQGCRASSLKIGSRSVTPCMEQATCQPDGRTRRQLPTTTTPVLQVASLCMQLDTTVQRVVGTQWRRVKELSLVSHKLKLVPPRRIWRPRKLATGQPYYTARVICGILFTVHLTNAHIARPQQQDRNRGIMPGVGSRQQAAGSRV